MPRLIPAAFLLLAVGLPARADEPSREEVERLKRLQQVERDLAKKLDKAKAEKAAPPAGELLRDVTLLQTLYPLKLTAEQRRAFGALAKETASKGRRAPTIKASDKLRQTLVQLREALVKRDDERVDQLGQKLEEQRKAEKVELEDEAPELTEAARRRAPDALRLLSAKQVAGYLAATADDITDPVELMAETMGKVRGLPEDEWKQTRDDVAERVAQIVAGLDDEKVDEISERVAALLIEARNLKEADFKARKGDLEKAGRRIVGNLGPTDLLRNQMERVLAEVLSNPRLTAVLDNKP